MFTIFPFITLIHLWWLPILPLITIRASLCGFTKYVREGVIKNGLSRAEKPATLDTRYGTKTNKTKTLHRQLKGGPLRTQPSNQGWTQVLMKDKQFLFLTILWYITTWKYSEGLASLPSAKYEHTSEVYQNSSSTTTHTHLEGCLRYHLQQLEHIFEGYLPYHLQQHIHTLRANYLTIYNNTNTPWGLPTLPSTTIRTHIEG